MSEQNNNQKLSIEERDKSVIWHPLTQHKTATKIISIVKAKGSILYDKDNNAYIDAISSWYTCMYGHCNKRLIKAIHKQATQLDQIIFSGFTHQPAVELAEKLINLLPSKLSKVFYNDNGSTATEIGIKMALQYHFNLGIPKDTIIAFEEGFHGDTFGSMSVSGLSVYNGAFTDHFLKVIRIPKPNGNNNQSIIQNLQSIVKRHKIAGFIYEPIVQGAAGMKFYDKQGLNDILIFCNKEKIITIADEVMTGFGKTGTCFASEQIDTQPDIMCLSKALTAGMIPMGITTCQDFIFKAFYDDSNTKAFFHAHTYSANPLACAVALEAIKIFKSHKIQNCIRSISESHELFKLKFLSHPNVKSIRNIGIILAIDLNLDIERYGSIRDLIFQFFMDRGIYLRPLGHTVYIVPPYTIRKSELSLVYKALEEVLDFSTT